MITPSFDTELKEFCIRLGITEIEEMHCRNATEYRIMIKRKIAKAVKEVWDQDEVLTLTKATEKWRQILGSSKE